MDFNGTINSTFQEQDYSQASIVRNSALVISLVLNIWICLMFRTALFSISLMNFSPVNMMIILDESVKMIMLFGQSFLVYHLIEGRGTKMSETVFGPRCWILFLASHVGIATSYVGGAAIAMIRLIHINSIISSCFIISTIHRPNDHPRTNSGPELRWNPYNRLELL